MKTIHLSELRCKGNIFFVSTRIPTRFFLNIQI